MCPATLCIVPSMGAGPYTPVNIVEAIWADIVARSTMVKKYNIPVKAKIAKKPSAGQTLDSNTIGQNTQSWLEVRLSQEIPRPRGGGVLRQMWRLRKACPMLQAAHAQLNSSGAGFTMTEVMSTRGLSGWSLTHVQIAHVPVIEISLGLSRTETYRLLRIRSTGLPCWMMS
jgi:hypothetical protein